MKSGSFAQGLWVSLALACLPATASANVYDIAVAASGDVVSHRSWGGGANYVWDEVAASPNVVFHNYSYGYGEAAGTSLTFSLASLPVKAADIVSASFNFKVLSTWSDGRDDVANFSAGGSVLASNGIGWKSFDVTSSLVGVLGTSASTVTYGLAYTGYSGMSFASAEGGAPAFLRITTAVPEPETYAMLMAGLGLLGFVARRRGRRA